MHPKHVATILLACGVQMAHAEDLSPWYLGVSAGNNSVPNMQWPRATYVTGFSSGSTDISVDMASATSQAVTLGYRVNPNMALETEFSRRQNDSRQLVTHTGFVLAGHMATTKVDSLMLSLKYKFFDDKPVQPFIGVGIGGANLGIEIQDSNGRSSNSAWKVAYQLLAGVEVPITRQWSLTGSIQYFKIPNSDINVDRQQTSTSTNIWTINTYEAQTIAVGAQFRF